MATIVNARDVSIEATAPRLISTKLPSNVSIDYSNVNARPKIYSVVSVGAAGAGMPRSRGFWDMESGSGTNLYAFSRSYNVVKIQRSTGAIVDMQSFDVYLNSSIADSMATYLNSLSSDYYVVIGTYDEPQANRLTANLLAAMKRCGASSVIYGSANFQYRGAYILIGVPGCGEANGIESYAGSISSDTNAWCEVTFYLQNGVLVSTGASSIPKTISDYGFTGALDATRNKVTYSSEAPSNPANGDIWVDTSAIPTTTKVYSGGAWVASANNTTELGGSGVNFLNPRYTSFAEATLPPVFFGNGTATLDTSTGYFGSNSLKLMSSVTDNYCYLSSNSYTTNFSIQPNKKWIVSAYVKSNTSSAPGELFIVAGGAHYATTFTTSATANTWTRVSGLLDLTAQAATMALLRVDNNASGVTMWFDGIMVEPQIGQIQTPSPFSTQPNFLEQFTGSLQATKNIVTTSSTAPSSPSDGDIWIDTSVSPNLTKLRAGGAWVVGANYVTNTNQIVDGAGLGNTAMWGSVSQKPDSAGNLARKTSFEDGTVGTWNGLNIAVANSPGTAWSKQLIFQGRDSLELGSDFPVTPGEKLYVACDINTSACPNYDSNVGFYFKDSSGASVNWIGKSVIKGAPYQRVTGSVIVPANSVIAVPWIQINGASNQTTDTLKVTNLYFGRQEPGATVGAPSGTLVGSTLAELVEADVAAAKSQLVAIASDSFLSRGEKPSAIKDWTALDNEKTGIINQANGFGATLQASNYSTAISALSAYLGSLTPSWTDTSQDTPIVQANWLNLWDDVWQKRQICLNSIAAATATLSTWTGTSSKPANVAALTGTEPIQNSLIEVGATNLWKNSTKALTIMSGTGTSSLVSMTLPDGTTGNALRVVNSGATTITCRVYNAVRQNDVYSLSLYHKLAAAGTWSFDVCDSNATTVNATTSWQYYKKEGFTVSNYSLAIYNFVDVEIPPSATLDLWHPQIEYGNKASDWKYAVEDIDSNITVAGTTATWAGIPSGSGKPADNATKNIVTYSSTAPSNPSDGDLWGDQSVNPWVIKMRVGGAWQIAANLSTDTIHLTDSANLGKTALWSGIPSGTGKPADYATKNTVTYSTIAPTSPTDGDLWCDQSVNPWVIKMRVGGAWQAAANYSTDTTHLTDGANLGKTSLWTGVSGVPYASIFSTDDGTVLGVNGAFAEWTSTYPVGWASWAGTAPIKDTTNVVKADGTASARFVAAGTNSVGMLLSPIAFSPALRAGTSIMVGVSMYISNYTSGQAGYLVRLFTNAALTTYVDAPTTTINSATSGWVRRTVLATLPNVNSQIYGIQIFAMASWSGFGSLSTLTVNFENFDVRLIEPGLTNQSIGVTESGGTLVITPVNSGGATVTTVTSNNKITSANVASYMGSAAIQDAYIANLNANKITTGFLDAARINTGTLTADKIVVGGITQLAYLTTTGFSAQTTISNTTTGLVMLDIDIPIPVTIPAGNTTVASVEVDLNVNVLYDAIDANQYYIGRRAFANFGTTDAPTSPFSDGVEDRFSTSKWGTTGPTSVSTIRKSAKLQAMKLNVAGNETVQVRVVVFIHDSTGASTFFNVGDVITANVGRALIKINNC